MDDVRVETERIHTSVIVRFAHAQTRNALDRSTRAHLIDLLAELDADASVHTVIITGTDPAFTSGVDAKQLLTADYTPLPRNPAEALRAMDTPTIAAVNGACVSGGLEIALACSFIISSEHARFADTHARLGIIPGWGLSAELPTAVGVARARQMTLTGESIDARTALQWGLVNEVVPHGALMTRSLALATAVSGVDSRARSESMRLYRSGRDSALNAARAAEAVSNAGWRVDREAASESFSAR